MSLLDFSRKHFGYFKPFVVILTHANRGNVAVICWNTLNSKKWGVTGEEIDGVNYGDREDVKTLLAIYFPDFVYEGKNEVFTKEAEGLTVAAVPSTKTTIGDRQIVLTFDNSETDGWKNFVKAFEKKSGDKKTYITDEGVVAYVPENVYADVDSLLGKEVTILFGEDNVVAVIEITNDSTFDSAYVEKYKNGKVTIDGIDYTFAKDAVVTVNTLVKIDENTNAEAVMTALVSNLGETSGEDFVKLVKANVILNSDEEISRLDLSVSGSYDDYKTFEAIATKNRNDILTYHYFYKEGTDLKVTKTTFDYKDLTSKKMPKVYKNGETIDITDIEANDVLTVYYGTSKSDLKIIYVSDKTVAGEVTKTQKTDKKIYVDGNAYTPSMKSLVVTDKELTKGGYKVDGAIGTEVSKKDDVTAYLNIYGEYVVISTDSESTNNYTIGYVIATKVADADGDVVTKKIRVLLPDGTKPWYTITAEESDDISYDDVEGLDTLKNDVIAFEANSDKEIEIEKTADIVVIANVDLNAKTITKTVTIDPDFDKDYDVETIENTATVNDSKNKLNDYRFREGKTVVVDAKATSVSTKWNSIIKSDKKLIGNTVVICKDGKTDIEYMFFYSTEDSSSDVMYAIAKEIYDDEVVLVNDEGESTLEYTTQFNETDLGKEEGFVVYKTNSKDKVREAAMLVDVKTFNDWLLTENADKEANEIIKEGLGTKVALTSLDNVTKEHFEVDTLDLDLLELSFKDEVSNDLDQLATIDLDEDTVVYDLRDGFTVRKLDNVDLSTSAYIIPFKDGECDKDADANILVILD